MSVGCIDIQIQGGMARGEKGREMEESEVSTRLQWLTDLLLQGEEEHHHPCYVILPRQ